MPKMKMKNKKNDGEAMVTLTLSQEEAVAVEQSLINSTLGHARNQEAITKFFEIWGGDWKERREHAIAVKTRLNKAIYKAA